MMAWPRGPISGRALAGAALAHVSSPAQIKGIHKSRQIPSQLPRARKAADASIREPMAGHVRVAGPGRTLVRRVRLRVALLAITLGLALMHE
jgi:hypothetical protein